MYVCQLHEALCNRIIWVSRSSHGVEKVIDML
jgi:hypothetical protein